MKHKQETRHFNRSKDERQALLRHLATALIYKGKIETTVTKAKETRRFVDQLIQFGIRGDLLSYRRALVELGNSDVTSFLFKEIAPLCKSRQGGHTRMFRSRLRLGDGAEMAILELLERKVEPKKEAKEKPRAKEEPKREEVKKVEVKKEKIKETPPSELSDQEPEKKKEKRGGFLSNLRKFLKPGDRS